MTTTLPPPDGHAVLLQHLKDMEASDPLIRVRLAGRVVFDMVGQMLQGEKGVRIEDLLGVLASTGGFACLAAAADELPTLAAGQDHQHALVVVTDDQGRRYFFGDLPNKYLLESPVSLLGLALAAAREHGATLPPDAVTSVMRRVAGHDIGKDGVFGHPVLPEEHRLADLPINFVRHLWPKILEALALYEVPVAQRPAALGIALQIAIDEGKEVLAPAMAATIAIECAVPMAKIDPQALWRDTAPQTPPGAPQA